jgi:hypothetical protein
MASSKGKKKQKVKRNHSPKKANGVVRSAKIPIKLESKLFEQSKEKLHSNFRIASYTRITFGASLLHGFANINLEE